MAANNFSVQQFRRDRTLNIVKGEPKFLNQIITGSNDNEIYCFLSPHDTLSVSQEYLYEKVIGYYNSGIKVLYTDNEVSLETLQIRQYIPSINYDKNIVINTPLIILGKSKILFNEKMQRLMFWDYLQQAKKSCVIHHIPEAMFKVASITKEVQEKDLKCLRR